MEITDTTHSLWTINATGHRWSLRNFVFTVPNWALCVCVCIHFWEKPEKKNRDAAIISMYKCIIFSLFWVFLTLCWNHVFCTVCIHTYESQTSVILFNAAIVCTWKFSICSPFVVIISLSFGFLRRKERKNENKDKDSKRKIKKEDVIDVIDFPKIQLAWPSLKFSSGNFELKLEKRFFSAESALYRDPLKLFTQHKNTGKRGKEGAQGKREEKRRLFRFFSTEVKNESTSHIFYAFLASF